MIVACCWCKSDLKKEKIPFFFSFLDSWRLVNEDFGHFLSCTIKGQQRERSHDAIRSSPFLADILRYIQYHLSLKKLWIILISKSLLFYYQTWIQVPTMLCGGWRKVRPLPSPGRWSEPGHCITLQGGAPKPSAQPMTKIGTHDSIPLAFPQMVEIEKIVPCISINVALTTTNHSGW